MTFCLHFLKKTLKKSKIEKIYDFTVFDWNKNQKTIIKNIQKKFSKQKIIIRSSALDEDSIKKSRAGIYESILNIDTNSISKYSECFISLPIFINNQSKSS